MIGQKAENFQQRNFTGEIFYSHLVKHSFKYVEFIYSQKFTYDVNFMLVNKNALMANRNITIFNIDF